MGLAGNCYRDSSRCTLGNLGVGIRYTFTNSGFNLDCSFDLSIGLFSKWFTYDCRYERGWCFDLEIIRLLSLRNWLRRCLNGLNPADQIA
mgnify:CR=1 FL=1